MQLTEPHCSVMYQEDLKLENYAISVAHLPPGNRLALCPVPDTFVASSMSSLCVMPSFCWKYCKQIKSKETPKPINSWAARWATLPWKHFGVDFLCSVSSYQAEVLLKCCSWRCPPCSDDTEVKNWLQYSWAPDCVVKVSFVQQTSWQTTVRCDHGCGMWHALWKQFLYLN